MSVCRDGLEHFERLLLLFGGACCQFKGLRGFRRGSVFAGLRSTGIAVDAFQMSDESSEAVCRSAIVEAGGGRLSLRILAALGGGDRIAGARDFLAFGIRKEESAPGFAHVPFDVVGEHAEKEVGADPVRGAMVDGTDPQTDRLDRSKYPLHARQRFVVPHAVRGGHIGLGQRGSDHVDAVEGGFLRDAVLLAAELQAVGGDLPLEVLFHLVVVDLLADALRNLGFAGQGSLLDPGGPAPRGPLRWP